MRLVCPLLKGEDFDIIQQEILILSECKHKNIVGYLGSYLRCAFVKSVTIVGGSVGSDVLYVQCVPLYGFCIPPSPSLPSPSFYCCTFPPPPSSLPPSYLSSLPPFPPSFLPTVPCLCVLASFCVARWPVNEAVWYYKHCGKITPPTEHIKFYTLCSQSM